MKKALKTVGVVMVGVFALIGLLFSAVFVAMQFDLLSVPGAIKDRNQFFLDDNEAFVVGSAVPASGVLGEDGAPVLDSCLDGSTVCTWSETREWAVVKGGLQKDFAVIEKVSEETGVPARLIAAVVVPEQIRFFTSSREVFKRYFEPLKILGSLSKFSLGVSGIKQETAEAIEQYANDETSPRYPGEGYARMLAYENENNKSEQLFLRLTSEKDHYYSYLYTAIFIKEVLSEWETAGYDLEGEAEIIATIFNLGFGGSNPKPNPVVGGAAVSVGGRTYSFGALAGMFYYSEELPKLTR